MAEERRMTVAVVVANVLAGEQGDFVREAVALVARELMEAEVSAEIGAGHGEVSVERTTHRNGYRPRGWETRVGEIGLAIPRTTKLGIALAIFLTVGTLLGAILGYAVPPAYHADIEACRMFSFLAGFALATAWLVKEPDPAS